MFFFCILKVTQDFGTDADPDPSVKGIDTEHPDLYQNVTDPDHWPKTVIVSPPFDEEQDPDPDSH
jgi:hypothetical protein